MRARNSHRPRAAATAAPVRIQVLSTGRVASSPVTVVHQAVARCPVRIQTLRRAARPLRAVSVRRPGRRGSAVLTMRGWGVFFRSRFCGGSTGRSCVRWLPRSRGIVVVVRRGVRGGRMMILLSWARDAGHSPGLFAGFAGASRWTDTVRASIACRSDGTPVRRCSAGSAADAGDVDGIGQLQGDRQADRTVVHGGRGVGGPRPRRRGGSPACRMRASYAARTAMRATTWSGITVAPRRAGGGREGWVCPRFRTASRRG